MIGKALNLIVPLISTFVIFYWGNKISLMKRTTDQRVIDLEVAQKLKAMIDLDDTEENRLAKERYAKLVLRNDNATFEDLQLLIKSRNVDSWGIQYFKVKKQLNIVYNESRSKIVLLTYDTPRSKLILLVLGYFVFALLGSIPYIFNNWFVRLVRIAQKDNSYLSVSLISVFCFLMILSAGWSLIQAAKEKSAKDFVNKFYERGVYRSH